MASHPCPHQDVCSSVPGNLQFRAVASFSGLAALRLISLSHRSVSLPDFAALSIGSGRAAALHERLTAEGIPSVVLSTCNRTEVYWRAQLPGDDETPLGAVAELLGLSSRLVASAARYLQGEAVAEHLFRVCCGLESLVIGEAEIAGQVRGALGASPGAGSFLSGVFRAALRAGRFARAETGIGTGAMSVASTAIHWLAREVTLSKSHVLVIGAGDTGMKAARQVRAQGAARLTVANRNVPRAIALAQGIGADAIGLDDLAAVLPRVDAVVCTASAPGWLVAREHLSSAMASRPSRSMFVIDLAMPPGIERGEVPGVRHIDMTGLHQVVAENRRRREAHVPQVEAIIERELTWTRTWARHEALRPLVSTLRRKVEAIRRTELAKAQRELAHGAPVDLAVLDRLSRRLLDQVLGIPLATLEAGDLPLDAAHAEYLRRLFALEPAAKSGAIGGEGMGPSAPAPESAA